MRSKLGLVGSYSYLVVKREIPLTSSKMIFPGNILEKLVSNGHSQCVEAVGKCKPRRAWSPRSSLCRTEACTWRMKGMVEPGKREARWERCSEEGKATSNYRALTSLHGFMPGLKACMRQGQVEKQGRTHGRNSKRRTTEGERVRGFAVWHK